MENEILDPLPITPRTAWLEFNQNKGPVFTSIERLTPKLTHGIEWALRALSKRGDRAPENQLVFTQRRPGQRAWAQLRILPLEIPFCSGLAHPPAPPILPSLPCHLCPVSTPLYAQSNVKALFLRPLSKGSASPVERGPRGLRPHPQPRFLGSPDTCSQEWRCSGLRPLLREAAFQFSDGNGPGTKPLLAAAHALPAPEWGFCVEEKPFLILEC